MAFFLSVENRTIGRAVINLFVKFARYRSVWILLYRVLYRKVSFEGGLTKIAYRLAEPQFCQ
jgi:hypothetical protein